VGFLGAALGAGFLATGAVLGAGFLAVGVFLEVGFLGAGDFFEAPKRFTGPGPVNWNGDGFLVNKVAPGADGYLIGLPAVS